MMSPTLRKVIVGAVVAGGTAVIAAKKMIAKQEGTQKVKENGKKILDDTKEFASSVADVAKSVGNELKEKGKAVADEAKSVMNEVKEEINKECNGDCCCDNCKCDGACETADDTADEVDLAACNQEQLEEMHEELIKTITQLNDEIDNLIADVDKAEDENIRNNFIEVVAQKENTVKTLEDRVRCIEEKLKEFISE